MSRLVNACACLALLGAAAAGGSLARLFWVTTDDVATTLTAAQSTMFMAQSELVSISSTARVTSKAVLQLVDRQMTGIRADAMKVVGKVDARAGETLDEVQMALNGVKLLQETVQPTLNNLASITKHVDDISAHVADTVPLFTDCEYNVDCLFNRVQGTSKAVEKTMQAVAKAAPDVAASAVIIGKSAEGTGNSIDGIAADVHKVTSDFVKPATTGQKIKGWFKFFAEIAVRAL